MSDEIIININPSASDNIIIDATTSPPENIQITPILSDVISVNGKTGVVVLNKGDIGLDQVDNTSDLNKPLSNSATSALFLKADLSLLGKYIPLSSVDTQLNINSTNVVQNSAVAKKIQDIENLIIKDFSEYLPLSGGDISGNLNVQTKLLSAGTDLLDIFLRAETDSQTLFYNITSEDLTIVRGNTVNLSSLSYRNIGNQASTIQEFASSYSGSIFQGYTVTLYNERVYAFAGTDKNNPNHYLEVNSNPYKPIYREVSLSGNEIILDTFYLGDFKSAKYNLQIETNFNNDIYYSEINVIGSVQTSIGTACEYGVIFTDQLIMGYDAKVSINNLNLILYYNYDPTPDRKLIIKGLRTNFYKI
jgi:hypothetical protein